MSRTVRGPQSSIYTRLELCELKSPNAADSGCQASTGHQSQSTRSSWERYRKAGRHARQKNPVSAGGSGVVGTIPARIPGPESQRAQLQL